MTASDFHDLLQVALGRKARLAHPLDDEGWDAMWHTCLRQSLLGVAYVACCKLPPEQRPARTRLLQWAGQAQLTAEANERLTATCAELTERLEQRG